VSKNKLPPKDAPKYLIAEKGKPGEYRTLTTDQTQSSAQQWVRAEGDAKKKYPLFAVRYDFIGYLEVE